MYVTIEKKGQQTLFTLGVSVSSDTSESTPLASTSEPAPLASTPEPTPLAVGSYVDNTTVKACNQDSSSEPEIKRPKMTPTVIRKGIGLWGDVTEDMRIYWCKYGMVIACMKTLIFQNL